MPGTPSAPTHPQNPAGGTDLIRKARTDVNKRLRSTRKWLIGQLEQIPTERITTNALPGGPYIVNRSTYEYQISAERLQAIVNELRRRLTDPATADLVVSRVRQAYERGTGDVVSTLSGLTADYTRTVTQVLSSQPWQRRVALVSARVFEQMEGFGSETATDLGRVLMQGVEDGQNPLEVAKTVRDRFGVARSRAERIARTEITGALRRATWDESESARVELGVRNRLVWFSALSSTTRQTHAAKHGKTLTQEEVRDFYSRDGNAINCKCSQKPILIDADGNPIGQRLLDRLRRSRERFQGDQ